MIVRTWIIEKEIRITSPGRGNLRGSGDSQAMRTLMVNDWGCASALSPALLVELKTLDFYQDYLLSYKNNAQLSSPHMGEWAMHTSGGLSLS